MLFTITRAGGAHIINPRHITDTYSTEGKVIVSLASGRRLTLTPDEGAELHKAWADIALANSAGRNQRKRKTAEEPTQPEGESHER